MGQFVKVVKHIAVIWGIWQSQQWTHFGIEWL